MALHTSEATGFCTRFSFITSFSSLKPLKRLSKRKS